MGKMERIDSELKRLEKQKAKLSGKKSDILRNMLVKCVNCHKQSKICEWTFVQKYWYVRPSGCTEGDYWKHDEYDTCDIMCAKCSFQNYIYNHPQKTKILQIIKDNPSFGTNNLFKKVVESHKC